MVVQAQSARQNDAGWAVSENLDGGRVDGRVYGAGAAKTPLSQRLWSWKVPLFNAGRGAVFTNEGEVELDASIMLGEDPLSSHRREESPQPTAC